MERWAIREDFVMVGNENRPIGRRDFLGALGAGVASGAMLAQAMRLRRRISCARHCGLSIFTITLSARRSR